MRKLAIIGAALLSLAACNSGNAPQNAAENTATVSEAAAAALPAGFPVADLSQRAAECIVYLGLSRQANATPGGHDAPIMQQSSDQWRASLSIDQHMSDAEIEQLVGSSVNVLSSTAAEQRDAASAWCVENAAEPDPEHPAAP